MLFIFLCCFRCNKYMQSLQVFCFFSATVIELLHSAAFSVMTVMSSEEGSKSVLHF